MYKLSWYFLVILPICNTVFIQFMIVYWQHDTQKNVLEFIKAIVKSPEILLKYIIHIYIIFSYLCKVLIELLILLFLQEVSTQNTLFDIWFIEHFYIKGKIFVKQIILFALLYLYMIYTYYIYIYTYIYSFPLNSLYIIPPLHLIMSFNLTFNYHTIYRLILFTESSLPREEPSVFIKANDTQSR